MSKEISHDSQELFRLIAENVHDFAVFVTDIEGRILSWNPGVGSLLGYDEGEWVGRHASLIFTPEDLEQRVPEWEMETALREGRAEDNRWHVRKDGSRFWANGFLMLLKDARGEPLGFAKIMRDDTAHKATEEDLRRTKARLESALEAGLAGTFYWDIPRDRIVTDENMRRYFSLREQATGEGVRLEEVLPAIHEDDRERVARALAGAVRYSGEYSVEYRVKHPDGVRWLSARGRVERDDAGKVTGLPGFSVDITERKRAEAERELLLAREQEARGEAEEANRLKDEFLATLSHELRTPLTAILGWARMLRSGAIPAETVGRALEAVERNAQAQKQLIEDLLDVSRIITGKLHIEARPLTMISVVEAAVDTVRQAADAKKIRLRVMAETGTGTVSGDSDRLQQVVWNLLSNAIKFTPEGGEVSIRLERSGGSVRVRVADTGRGIEPEFLPYVFDRFRQADATTTRLMGGLGLGLAIVRHIVEAHGGSVEAESDGHGKGAAFTFTLPATLPARPSATAQAARADLPETGLNCPPALRGLNVLVVDDDTDTLHYVASVLEYCGARVRRASSADEALASFKEEAAEVLVSDIGMPGTDGYELMRKVRKLPRKRGGRVPAVALTAYAREEDRLDAYRAGFQAHLSKPVAPDDLLTVIANLVGEGAEG
jgi:PAS domain S-box-containing protein